MNKQEIWALLGKAGVALIVTIGFAFATAYILMWLFLDSVRM